MENKKDAFIFYLSWVPAVEKMTDQQAGQLVKAICNYQTNKNIQDIEDPAVEMVFSIIREQLDLANQKYEEKCKKNREAAHKRWAKNNANASDYMHPNANASVGIPKIGNEKIRNDNDKKENDIDMYGTMHNVTLSQEEYNILKTDYPNDYDKLIDKLSNYMESTGKTYKNHYATIRLWAENDGITQSNERKYIGFEETEQNIARMNEYDLSKFV